MFDFYKSMAVIVCGFALGAILILSISDHVASTYKETHPYTLNLKEIADIKETDYGAELVTESGDSYVWVRKGIDDE